MPEPTESAFAARHIGLDAAALSHMLAVIGVGSLDEMAAKALPGRILDTLTDRGTAPGLESLPEPVGEHQALAELREMADANTVAVSMIGQGYYDTLTPPVLLRNIMENPAWYTAYTPYQPEISQGRLEAVLNFQTMVADLTGLDIANASMLDEATAAAEAMTLDAPRGQGFGEPAGGRRRPVRPDRGRAGHPGRAAGHRDRHRRSARRAARRRVLRGDRPTTRRQRPHHRLVGAGRLQAHERGALVAVGADLLACTLVAPPGDIGADVAFGSAQRFGVPMGFGGPHAGYLAAHTGHARQLPGRLVGVSVDADGAPAYRLSLQTREQHIRRDKATSNICTAQVLLAVMAGMYASYHGAEGLTAIARRVHDHARSLAGRVSRRPV